MLQSRIREGDQGQILDYASVENMWSAITRFFGQIGIKDNGYSARTFRKTFITLCQNCEMDASVVSKLVGHEHRSTADRFYNNITTIIMRRELEKFNSRYEFNTEDSTTNNY